ncbi:MAG: radical SAM protein [Cuniculiplasma sp.]
MGNISQKLKLIIFPTEECNFRCKYCYENFSIGEMNPEVVEGIKSLLLERSKDLNRLDIEWFGGEPLLAYDIIEDLLIYARNLSKKYNFTLESRMTTNASLFSPKLQPKLIGLGITEYQISFDGDREMHDKYRVTRGDKGSFDIIYNNLINFHKTELDATIIIRIHVNDKNYFSIERLLERMASDFENDQRMRFFIRGLSRMGGKNNMIIPVVDDMSKLNSMVTQLRNKATNLGLMVYGSNESQKYVCYAASFNSYIVRSTGAIGKCTVALYDERNIVGKLSRDGKIVLDKERLKFWVRGQFSRNSSELECPLHE